MASDLMRKFAVPERLMPARVSFKMEEMLSEARIDFSANEWVGLFAIAGGVLFVVGLLVRSVYIGAGLFAVALASSVLVPKMKIDSRREKLAASLPDALHQMSISMRTGMVIESAIQEIADSEYDVLSDEFSQVMVEMRRGRTLKDALLGFSERAGSRDVDRAVRLITEGLEFGSPISDVLDEVSEDMRAVRAIQRERKAMTSQQLSFVAVASLFAGPFVMGVVAALPNIMMKIAGESALQFPLDDINKVVNMLSLYVFGQACSAGLMVGVVMYGDFKKGFKFMIPMAIVAYLVFTLVKAFVPRMISSFGG